MDACIQILEMSSPASSCLTYPAVPHTRLYTHWPSFQEGLGVGFLGGLCMHVSFCLPLKGPPSFGPAPSRQSGTSLTKAFLLHLSQGGPSRPFPLLLFLSHRPCQGTR